MTNAWHDRLLLMRGGLAIAEVVYIQPPKKIGAALDATSHTSGGLREMVSSELHGYSDLTIGVNFISDGTQDLLNADIDAGLPQTYSVVFPFGLGLLWSGPAYVTEFAPQSAVASGPKAFAAAYTLRPAGTRWWLAGGIDADLCVAAYQADGAANFDASLINLANPGTYDLTLGVAPGWTWSDGWAFNGSTQYLKTGIVPAADTWSMLASFSGSPTNLRTVGGSYNASARCVAISARPTEMRARNGNYLDTAPLMTDGVYGFAGLTAYRNGIAEPGAIPAGTMPIIDIYIGALNAGFATQFWPGKIHRFVIYQGTITAQQTLVLTGAMT